MAMDGAFESLGAVAKYADEVTELTYANKLDIDSDFKGSILMKAVTFSRVRMMLLRVVQK